LTVKASLIFKKQFTVLKIVNHFPKLYSFSLHPRLTFNYPNPAIIDRPKPGSTGIKRHLATVAGCRRTRFWQNLAGIRPWPEIGRNPAWSDRIQPLIWPKWPGSGRIWPDPATDPAGSGQNGRNPAWSDWIRSDLTGPRGVLTESGHFGQIQPNMFAGFRRQLHFPFP
jgi:hypothetical protein